jgi:hypothetical protein
LERAGYLHNCDGPMEHGNICLYGDVEKVGSIVVL